MQVRSIELDGEEMPQRITVDMDRAEAVLIASLVGRLTEQDARSIIPCGGTYLHEIWDSLSGLLNRFYDGGVDEARREL